MTGLEGSSSSVPESRDELLALQGIGTKTIIPRVESNSRQNVEEFPAKKSKSHTVSEFCSFNFSRPRSLDPVAKLMKEGRVEECATVGWPSVYNCSQV